MSFYQSMKDPILAFFHLSKDAIHIHIGFACLVLMLFLSKKKLSSFYVILPGFIVSLTMEIIDLRDGVVYQGRLNLGSSLHDLVNTNFIPFILVILAKIKRIRIQS